MNLMKLNYSSFSTYLAKINKPLTIKNNDISKIRTCFPTPWITDVQLHTTTQILNINETSKPLKEKILYTSINQRNSFESRPKDTDSYNKRLNKGIRQSIILEKTIR